MREILEKDVDPSEFRRVHKEEVKTFKDMTIEWFNMASRNWDKKYAEKTLGRIKNHLLPLLGDKSIKDITTGDLIKCLRRLYDQGKVDTAHRVKQMASQVFRYASAKGVIQYDPTYPLRGLIPAPKSKHYPAPTDPRDFACILRLIWAYPYMTVRNALKILVYTFQRPGEVRTMKWEDISPEIGEWRFVVSKTHELHLVPLSRQVIEILAEMEPISKGISPYVFPSPRSNERPISDMTMNVALKSMGINTKEKITSHGFRAVARTMLAERLNFPPDVIELQLAHTVPDRLGRAYNRAKYLEVRREMMQKWAYYVDFLVTTISC